MSSTKRPSSTDADAPPAKRGLSSWLNVSAPKPPSPVVASPPFTDRRSTFVAHAAPVTTAHGAAHLHNYVRELRSGDHPREADHEMMAYRCMSLKLGKTGLGGEDDWTTKVGSEDDGEKGGGSQVRRSIEEGGGVDVAVVVSRWYGGIMLGQDRFKHIHTVTLQALAALELALALPTLLARLRELDDEIAAYTSSTSPVNPSSSAVASTDYEKQKLDMSKAERLIKAREKRLEMLKKKAKEEEDKVIEELEKEGAGSGEIQKVEEASEVNAEDADWEAAAAEVQALMDAAGEGEQQGES